MNISTSYITQLDDVTPSASNKLPVMSSSVDIVMVELVDLFIRDYISSWYTPLSSSNQPVLQNIRHDLWKTYQTLKKRLSAIDFTTFFTQNSVSILHQHFNDVKRCGDDEVEFKLHHFLLNKELELNYLRKITRFLLTITLPKEYSNSTPAIHLLTEIISCSGFYWMVDMICDPVYINEKLLSWIEYNEKVLEDYKKTYSYAATFEDFIKIINNCQDVENLKQMRYKILSEIMQATALRDLKRSISPSRDANSPRPATKGELLLGRDLKKYLKQLTYAKSLCEKLIFKYGGSDYRQYVSFNVEEHQDLPGKMVLSFSVIMNNSSARSSFHLYLRQHSEDKDRLIDFWEEVEACRSDDVDDADRHLRASHIYQRYLCSSHSSIFRQLLDRSIVRGLEGYLVGDADITPYYHAQRRVEKVLEERYYPSFLVSSNYQELVRGVDYKTYQDEQNVSGPHESTDTGTLQQHATSTHRQLRDVSNILSEKRHALDAMRASIRPVDPKVKSKLEMEIERLALAESQLKSYIEKTNIWCEYVGHWLAQVHNVEFLQDSESKHRVACFVIVVHLTSSRLSVAEHSSSTGWIISRTIRDLQKLHNQLSLIETWVKLKKLPTDSWFTLFKVNRQEYLDKWKPLIDEYFYDILRDERLCGSESLYNFMLPNIDNITKTLASSLPSSLLDSSLDKQPSFSLSKIFSRQESNLKVQSQAKDDIDENFLYLEEDSIKLGEVRNVKDSIAEPLYSLIGDLFQLKGMFRWFRRSLMLFVQVTFGKSINKQIGDTVVWLTSESMITYYLNTFKDSMWPNNCLVEPNDKIRTSEEKESLRKVARLKSISSLPDAAVSLLGQENAERGVKRLFDLLQNKQLNKHLFYSLLEQLMFTFSPELEQQRIQLHRSSMTSQTPSTSITQLPTLSTKPTQLPTLSTNPTQLPTLSTNPTELPTLSTNPTELPTLSTFPTTPSLPPTPTTPSLPHTPTTPSHPHTPTTPSLLPHTFFTTHTHLPRHSTMPTISLHHKFPTSPTNQKPILSTSPTPQQPTLSTSPTNQQPTLSTSPTPQQPTLSIFPTNQQPTLSTSLTNQQPTSTTSPPLSLNPQLDHKKHTACHIPRPHF